MNSRPDCPSYHGQAMCQHPAPAGHQRGAGCFRCESSRFILNRRTPLGTRAQHKEHPFFGARGSSRPDLRCSRDRSRAGGSARDAVHRRAVRVVRDRPSRISHSRHEAVLHRIDPDRHEGRGAAGCVLPLVVSEIETVANLDVYLCGNLRCPRRPRHHSKGAAPHLHRLVLFRRLTVWPNDALLLKEFMADVTASCRRAQAQSHTPRARSAPKRVSRSHS